VTPLYPSKLALASLTGGGRSVGLDPHGLLRQGLLFLLLTVNGGESISKYHTLLAIAKFTGKRKKFCPVIL
jgi:hypothetical protein